MGDVIDMRIPFHLRRLQADLARAERDYGQFHDKFEQQLLDRYGHAIPASILMRSRQAEEQQRILDEAAYGALKTRKGPFIMYKGGRARHIPYDNIILPPKPEEE